jgi:hypothetical protein
VLRLECNTDDVLRGGVHALGNALDELARTTGSGVVLRDAPDAPRSRGVVRLTSAGVDVVLPAGYRARVDWTAEELADTRCGSPTRARR